jgi:hypothetical protein
LPGADVEEQELPDEGTLPANFWRGTDLVVVDASGSVTQGPAAQTPVGIVRRLREEQPSLPILATFMTPAVTGLTVLEYAQARMLEAGATDVAALTSESPASRTLLEHRIRQVLLGAQRGRGWERMRVQPTAQPFDDTAGPVPFVEDPFRMPWLELYHPVTRRLDATRIAEALGTKLRPLTAALGLSYKAVHRAPDAPAYQAALRPVARILEMLHDAFRTPAHIRAWLNKPRADLEGDSPLSVILAGEGSAVVSLLEGVQLGVGF